MLLGMIRQIKVSSDRFRCIFVVSLNVAKMFSESECFMALLLCKFALITHNAPYSVNSSIGKVQNMDSGYILIAFVDFN